MKSILLLANCVKCDQKCGGSLKYCNLPSCGVLLPDHLHYTCFSCGYDRTEPCADAPKEGEDDIPF